MAPRAGVEHGVALGVAPAQVRLDGLAGDVVEDEPARAVVDEREAAEPAEELVRVRGARRLVAEQRGEQRLGHGADERGALDGRPVPRRGHVADEALEQRADDVGRLGGDERRAGALPHALGDERERERVAVRERGHARAVRLGHVAAVEERLGLVGREVAERQHADGRGPRGVRRPRRRGAWRPAMTTSRSADCAGRKTRWSQPSRSCAASNVSSRSRRRPPARRVREGGVDGAREAVGRRLDVAQVQQGRWHARPRPRGARRRAAASSCRRRRARTRGRRGTAAPRPRAPRRRARARRRARRGRRGGSGGACRRA